MKKSCLIIFFFTYNWFAECANPPWAERRKKWLFCCVLSKALKRTAIAKSAVCCVSDPDLPLLTLKHRKSHFLRAA
jgi:hypothetical protein